MEPCILRRKCSAGRGRPSYGHCFEPMGHGVPRLPAASHHANSETLNVCSASLRTKSDNRRAWVFRQHCLGIPRRRLPIVGLRGLNVHCLTRRFVSLTFSLPSPIPSPLTATYLSSSSLHPPVISISSEFSSALRGFTTFASLRSNFPCIHTARHQVFFEDLTSPSSSSSPPCIIALTCEHLYLPSLHRTTASYILSARFHIRLTSFTILATFTLPIASHGGSPRREPGENLFFFQTGATLDTTISHPLSVD